MDQKSKILYFGFVFILGPKSKMQRAIFRAIDFGPYLGPYFGPYVGPYFPMLHCTLTLPMSSAAGVEVL